MVDERDLYLAWSLKRSKAVNGCKTVVGVVGLGHLAGVVYHLKTPSQLRFRDLVGSRQQRKQQGSIPGWVVVLVSNVALAVVLQLLWEFFSHRAGGSYPYGGM